MADDVVVSKMAASARLMLRRTFMESVVVRGGLGWMA
jgi:hypothetical protein